MFLFYILLKLCAACDGSAEIGYLASTDPQFSCQWYITVPEDQELFITPRSLDMDQYCIDSVDVYTKNDGGWKRKRKYCRLSSYTIDFPTKIIDGPAVIKIEFNPNKTKKMIMFKKVPDNFHFRLDIEFQTEGFGASSIIQMLLSAMSNKNQNIGQVKAIQEINDYEDDEMNICNVLDERFLISETTYQSTPTVNIYLDEGDFEDIQNYDPYKEYVDYENNYDNDYSDNYYISYRRKRRSTSPKIIEPWRVSLVSEDFDVLCDGVVYGRNLVITTKICSQKKTPYFYAHIDGTYLQIKETLTSASEANTFGFANSLQVNVLERRVKQRASNAACLPDKVALFEPNCFINGEKVELSFDCGTLTKLLPTDQRCVKLIRYDSCVKLGTPIVCKFHNAPDYSIMGMVAWRIEPCQASGLLGLLDFAYHYEWLQSFNS